MASIPGRHDEVRNFVNKFLNLHGAGRKARLNLDCHGEQLWVSLHVQLGEQLGQGAPLLPNPKPGVVRTPGQTKPPPRRRRRKGGRPCREARRARRVLATFLALPFHCSETDETSNVDPAPAPALHSTEIVEANPNSAEAVDMDTTPTPPSTPATPHHVSDDEEAAARRHACRERDARQSLALSESDFPLKTSTRTKTICDISTTAMPAETMLGCESPDFDIDISIPSTRESLNSLPSPSPSEQPPRYDPRTLEPFRQLLGIDRARWDREMANSKLPP